jgi:tetratricopeptide (TPR) repeat protein
MYAIDALNSTRTSMGDAAPIFISYRRSDAAGHARALHEYLSGRLGDDRVFFDRSTIEGGDIFPDTLRRGVEACVALLALIAPDWLAVTGAEGTRRLDDPRDFVRQEIALALERGKKVIPVLFDDTPVPPADRLPEPLKALASCDALTLRGKTYEYDTQRRDLVRLLARVPGVREPLPEAGEAIAGGVAAQLPAMIEAATRGWQRVSDAQQETIRTLERQLGANETQLRAFFQIIGEAQVPPEQQPARLVEIAAEVRQLRAQVAPEPGDAPEVARLKDAARAALDAGRLQKADDLLEQVEAAQDAALAQQQRDIERQQIERAATTAQRGGVALTRLRYREAAKHFATAARRLPPGKEEQALVYLNREADALYRRGNEFGDNGALVDAIARYRALLDRRPRERVPLDWAMTQNNLGNALWRLGERKSGTGRLEEAVVAFREALKEYTRDRIPLYWAGTQNNLGNALLSLGERDIGKIGTGRLKEAVVACREALKERTRERVPLDWAGTQTNLGNALLRLGERDVGKIGTGRLEEAVAAYREALQECNRERASLQWATIQNNLGTALLRLGERDIGKIGMRRLEEAVAAYREALQECIRERVPLQWAMSQNNLGFALLRLGERESGTGSLEEAVAALREALEERARDRVPLGWAGTQTNLGNTLSTLGERTRDVSKFKKARNAIEAAFEAFIQAGQEQYRAYFEARLREIDQKIADLTEQPGAEG